MHWLKDKKVIITGGTAGIGKAIATLFVEQGAHVAIFGTNRERADQVVASLEALKVFPEQKILSTLVDVSNSAEVETAIQGILAQFGQVDVLINNAGITKDNLLMKMSEEDWDRVLDVNLKSVYNLCRSLARPMLKSRGGSIINVSSVVGLMGNAGQANYAASKAGMVGLSKALAKEWASRGIRVNCLAPGYIDTDMTAVLPANIKETLLTKIPLGRMGSPRDIAHAALFLASDLSNYVTGQVIPVDGGMVM
jgi:3-oxoacyl-[acyl-carrier protein] reductase